MFQSTWGKVILPKTKKHIILKKNSAIIQQNNERKDILFGALSHSLDHEDDLVELSRSPSTVESIQQNSQLEGKQLCLKYK